MPTYEYECDWCGELEIPSRTYEPLKVCPQCGNALRQIYSPSKLNWSTGKHTISFENRRKFTNPHTSYDSRKRLYFGGNI